jgi:hypothetical protein
MEIKILKEVKIGNLILEKGDRIKILEAIKIDWKKAGIFYKALQSDDLETDLKEEGISKEWIERAVDSISKGKVFKIYSPVQTTGLCLADKTFKFTADGDEIVSSKSPDEMAAGMCIAAILAREDINKYIK